MRAPNSRMRVQNIAYFRNKTINYNSVVKAFYVVDGIAYVSCNIEDYYDVIDRYSVNGYEWLNSEFTRFLEENCNNIPVEYPILLEICGGDLTDEQKATIEATIKNYYQMKLWDEQERYKDTKKRSIMVMTASIILFCIDMFSHYIMNVFPDSLFLVTLGDVVQIIFWFLLWSDCDIIFFQMRDAKTERSYAAQLASIQILFKDKFVDTPVLKEKRGEIFETVFDE